MNLKQISIGVSDSSDLSELVPLFLLLFVVRSTEPPYRLLRAYFVCTSVLKTYALATSKLGLNNMHAYHVLAIAELALLYLFYLAILRQRQAYLKLGLAFLAGFTLLDTSLNHKFHEFNNIAWGINASAIIVFGLVYYYRLYTRAETTDIERHPLFFINAGLLVYAAGSFFTYLFGWKILSQEAVGLFHNAWLIQSIANLVKNTVVAYGLWMMRAK